MKSTIAITYEDSFRERLSTCDGISVPFLPLFPRRYLISGGSGAGLPLLSSTHNCQWSTFPDPFWMFNSQLMVDCFSHSSLCLLAYWCSRRNQHVLIQSFRLWLLLLSASPPLPTKYPSVHWSQSPMRLSLSDAAGGYRKSFFQLRWMSLVCAFVCFGFLLRVIFLLPAALLLSFGGNL